MRYIEPCHLRSMFYQCWLVRLINWLPRSCTFSRFVQSTKIACNILGRIKVFDQKLMIIRHVSSTYAPSQQPHICTCIHSVSGGALAGWKNTNHGICLIGKVEIYLKSSFQFCCCKKTHPSVNTSQILPARLKYIL